MKRLIISGLSIFMMVGATTPAIRAQETTNNRTVSQLTPFSLVTQAYRGYFKNQGIPGYQRFIAAYQNGQIDARDLVKSAIATNQLSEEALTDQGYINAVKVNLEGLQRPDP